MKYTKASCTKNEEKHKKELLKMSRENREHAITTLKLAKEEAKAAKTGESTKPMKSTMKMGKKKY